MKLKEKTNINPRLSRNLKIKTSSKFLQE